MRHETMANRNGTEWRKQAGEKKRPNINRGIAPKQTRPKPGVVQPASLKQLVHIMDPASRFPTPIRPMGANSASTQCTTAVGGTVVDMINLNDITEITDTTVTAQAGVTLRELADELAEQGMEVAGTMDIVTRTVGGAVAGGCFGPVHDGDTAFIGSQAVAMTVVTPDGKVMRIDETRQNLLNVFRGSMGALGIILDVTFKIRPQTTFVLKQRKMDVATFGVAATRLVHQPVGIKFFYLPFKDRVYTELRRAQPDDDAKVRNFAWKLKDLGETSVLPAICGKLGRIVPIQSLRYSLVDGLHEMGQSLFTNTLTEGGSSAAEYMSQSGRYAGPPLEYSTWCFPAQDLGMLLEAYKVFAAEYYYNFKYRCDMPVVGFRLPQDQSALLSPSFDGPMFALRVVTSPHPKWEDYAMDYAEFAQRWGGVPLLNQSRCAEQGQVTIAFGSRLDFFKRIRRQLDSENRLVNPYLAQYVT
ncbi:MAG: FAD-binding oxidoreductase [Pseudomonadota bacterium]